MKKFLLVVLLLVIVTAGWFYLNFRAAAATEETTEKPSAKVETASLKLEPIAQTIEVFGVVASTPSGDRVIAAPYDSLVRHIHVGVGTTVAAGDLLLEVEPIADAKLALDSARSVLALAAKSLAATQERYDLTLATNQELLTAQQAEQDAQLKAASLAARGLGGDGRVIAAEAGVVSKLDVSSGALALLGTPLITLARSGQRVIRLGVEPAQAGSVKVGQPVTLTSAHRGDGGEEVSATVSTVGAVIDSVSGAIEVQATLPAGAPLLLGERVRAEIEIAKNENALVVPRSAVLPDDDKQILFTVKDGKAVRHEVKTGLTTAELVEVIASSSLHAGDRVVTLGNYELADGMAIQPTEKKAPQADQEKAEAKP